jgi:hypothetical protein
MGDKYDAMGHIMVIGLMFVIFGVVLAIVGGITGKDPDELMQPKASNAVVSETQEDPDLVPIELVRKMCYDGRYWVKVDGATVEIKMFADPDGVSRFHFVREST